MKVCISYRRKSRIEEGQFLRSPLLICFSPKRGKKTKRSTKLSPFLRPKDFSKGKKSAAKKFWNYSLYQKFPRALIAMLLYHFYYFYTCMWSPKPFFLSLHSFFFPFALFSLQNRPLPCSIHRSNTPGEHLSQQPPIPLPEKEEGGGGENRIKFY